MLDERDRHAVAPPFLRPALPGCEWLAAPGSLGDIVATLNAQLGHQLSKKARRYIGLALLARRVRDPLGPRTQILEHRSANHLRAAVEAMPQDAALWRALGTLHLLADHIPTAMTAFDHAQRLAPDDAADIELDLRRLCINRGLPHIAEERSRTSSITLPDDDRRACYAAATHRVRGQAHDAKNALIRARSHWPNSLLLSIEWAETLWAGGERVAAVRAFATTREDFSEPCVEWNYILALALQGEALSALHELERASPSIAAHPLLERQIRIAERTAKTAPHDQPLALRGALPAVDMSDVISFLGATRASGRLSVWTSSVQYELDFDRGQLVERPVAVAINGVDSHTPSSEIRQALLRILQLSEGHFEFIRRAPIAPDLVPVIRLDTQRLLLEASALLDEHALHHVGEEPNEQQQQRR